MRRPGYIIILCVLAAPFQAAWHGRAWEQVVVSVQCEARACMQRYMTLYM